MTRVSNSEKNKTSFDMKCKILELAQYVKWKVMFNFKKVFINILHKFESVAERLYAYVHAN